MSDLSCNSCGAPIHESDVFCRRCGAKQKVGGAEYKASICPKCGNAFRGGARFCDMCGEEFFAAEQGNVRPRGKRNRRRRRGCFLTLLLLVLMSGIAAPVIYRYKHKIPAVLETCLQSYEKLKEKIGDSYEQFKEKKRPVVVSEDITSAEQFPVISPDERENAADVNEATFTLDESDEEVLQEPTPPDAESGETETFYVIAVPVTEELSDVSPDMSVSPDISVSPDLTISTELPVSLTETTALSGITEVEWTERDGDGYSFLSQRDQAMSNDDEVLSVQGTVVGDRVRMRDRPSTRGNIRRQLNSGVSVDVTGRFASGEERYYWFQIRRAGEVGWIYGEFLQVESTDREVGDLERE